MCLSLSLYKTHYIHRNEKHVLKFIARFDNRVFDFVKKNNYELIVVYQKIIFK